MQTWMFWNDHFCVLFWFGFLLFQTKNPSGNFSGVEKFPAKCWIWSKSLFKIRLKYFKQFHCRLQMVSLIQWKFHLMKTICKSYHCYSSPHSYCCWKHFSVGSFYRWPLVPCRSLVAKASVQQLELGCSLPLALARAARLSQSRSL